VSKFDPFAIFAMAMFVVHQRSKDVFRDHSSSVLGRWLSANRSKTDETLALPAPSEERMERANDVQKGTGT